MTGLTILLAGVTMTLQGTTTDFAESRHLDAWLHHPVYGDPSFDAFERLPGNPLHRGAPPYEWPVNGSLFEDPVSGDWFVYVGEYLKGYAMHPEHLMRCTAYRSSDKGKTWKRLGGVFDEKPYTLEGDGGPVGHAPDVSVVYDGGRYHMIYDYCVANATWQGLTEKEPPDGNGVGYAWSERPEGPFHFTPKPVYRTGDNPLYRGKYRRGYAASLIRRANDWVVLMMLDSGPYFGWSLVGLSAPNPEGPYSPPVFLRTVEDGYYHPPLLEFFPAFQYKGRVYAPATSVAMNRNYQAVFSAKTEDMMNPDAWKADQLGSVWHAEPVENEYYGIWGQAFSGMPTADGLFQVMFPARDPNGMGTINLAARQWRQPYRERGFVMSGHGAPSLSLLRGDYDAFALDADLSVLGEAAILWGYQGALGPDKPAADAKPHHLALANTSKLELTKDAWHLTTVDAAGTRNEIASGPLGGPDHRIELHKETGDSAKFTLAVDGKEAWTGPWPGNAKGALGLLVSPNSRLEAKRFAVQGARVAATRHYLYTDALLGAAQSKALWKDTKASEFTYGEGVVSDSPQARAKWNVRGSGFTIKAPRGPEYGVANVWLDGKQIGTADFHAEAPKASDVVFRSNDIPFGNHALALTAREGKMPLDILEAAE